MCETPIKLIESQMRTDIENGIYKAIKEVGIDVDKEELIKALQYDRDQYSKGYADGAKEFAKKFEKKIKDVQFTLGQTWEIQCALTQVLKEMVGEE